MCPVWYSKDMKRLLLWLGMGLTIVIGGLAGFGAQLAAAQDVNSFTISVFDVDYYLSKDNEGRSTLKTVERITAQFPDFDQNHGLERALPEKYNGHSTNLHIESVTDGEGRKRAFSDSRSNDNLVLRIGDADTYVRGRQTYVITYLQRDIIHFFSDTNADEFYWDVNGTDWIQATSELHARVHVSDELARSLNGNASCYQGAEGSTTACSIARLASGTETLFTFGASSLKSHENVTLAIGFAPNTFVGYQQTWQEKLWAVIIVIWAYVLVITSILASIVLVWMSIGYYRLMLKSKGRSTIVPEYLPPKDTSVLASAHVLGNATSDITAQLIDLAVRHYLKIYQTKDKTFFQSAEYELEIVKNIDALQKEEQQLLKDLFGNTNVVPGSRFNMATLRKKYAIGAKLTTGRKEVKKSVRNEYGLYERATVEAKRFMTIGFIMLAVGILTVSPVVIIVSVVAFVFAGFAWPLTEKGTKLREYLQGLKVYISVAEEDRIKMLQSPDGAEKVGRRIESNDSARLVKLYERVLPYAVLFGIEKEWTKQLGLRYESAGEQPDWYTGNGAFNAVVFTSALNTFSSQSSSYSSAASSSSGGSSGGGSSGGGGGGGGGGGW